MQMLSPQLTLGLSLKDEATFENFYAGRNQEIISALKNTVYGRGEKIIYLCSSRGQGGSHLLQACCHEAHLYQQRSVYLPLTQLISMSPEILQGLESLSLVCIDDVHIIA